MDVHLSGVKISIATPKGFEPDKTVIHESKKFIDINLTTDPINAIKNADVVVTDTYSSIHNNDSKRIKKFLPKYQVTSNFDEECSKLMQSLCIVFQQKEKVKLRLL